jgi:hypothetical protein
MAVSVLLGFIAFGLGIDSLRVREKSVFGIEKYNELVTRAYTDAQEDGSCRKMQLSLIDFFEKAIAAEIKNNVWRGRRLRRMSIILLFSGASLGMELITYWAR